jgi:signal transduction histidine kinase
MVSLSGLTSLLCLAIGAVVLWSSPRRLANICFAILSLILALRFFGIAMAIDAGIARSAGEQRSPFGWLRFVSAIGSLTPWAIWLLRESIFVPKQPAARLFRRSVFWLIICLLYGASAFSDYHLREVPVYSPGAYGPAYRAMLGSFLVFQFVVCYPVIRNFSASTGVMRLELSYVVLNICTALSLMTISALIRAYFAHDFLRPATHVILISSYLVAAWAIANRRIFDARDTLLAFAPRLLALAGFFAAGVFLLRWHEAGLISIIPSAALLVVAASAALALEAALRRRFGVDHRSKLRDLRQRILTATESAADPTAVANAATDILRAEFGTSVALVAAPQFLADAVEIDFSRPGLQALGDIGWATHESLLRARTSVAIRDLQTFLRQHRLHAIVPASPARTAPTPFLALGEKHTGRPFSYGEIQRLQNIADLVASLLARARLASQAALEARMAHLALMSRGLAHDLKNLITPISAFLVHTEGRFAPGTPEGEVYRDARRSVRLMTDYVREAHFFSSRLQPRLEPLDVAEVFRLVHDAVRTQAHARGVDIALALPAPVALAGDRVLLQRLLANLVQNALDASAAGGVVTLRALGLPAGFVRLEVSDTGSGISSENLPRIFEPYFTTKQFGDDIRGFGLGLAIVEKIAHLHRGTVRVASTGPRGTTFAVDLPAASPAPAASLIPAAPDLPPPRA